MFAPPISYFPRFRAHLLKMHFYASLLLLLFSCSSPVVDTANIKALIEQGELSQAETLINEALTNDSSNLEINLLLADVLLKKGDYKKAYFTLQNARNADSTNVEVNLKLSQFHLFLARFQEAISSANDVLKIEKSNAQAYFLKGMSYKGIGDTAKAYSSFQTTIEQDANYYDAFIQLGILASARHDSLAVYYFDNALSLKANSPEALYNKALFFQQHGALNRAFNTYITIAEGSNFYGSAMFNCGSILYEQGKYPSALKFFNIASQYNSYKAFYMKGLIYEQQNKRDSALTEYQKCLDIKSDYALAQERLNAKGLKKK